MKKQHDTDKLVYINAGTYKQDCTGLQYLHGIVNCKDRHALNTKHKTVQRYGLEMPYGIKWQLTEPAQASVEGRRSSQ